MSELANEDVAWEARTVIENAREGSNLTPETRKLADDLAKLAVQNGADILIHQDFWPFTGQIMRESEQVGLPIPDKKVREGMARQAGYVGSAPQLGQQISVISEPLTTASWGARAVEEKPENPQVTS